MQTWHVLLVCFIILWINDNTITEPKLNNLIVAILCHWHLLTCQLYGVKWLEMQISEELNENGTWSCLQTLVKLCQKLSCIDATVKEQYALCLIIVLFLLYLDQMYNTKLFDMWHAECFVVECFTVQHLASLYLVSLHVWCHSWSLTSYILCRTL